MTRTILVALVALLVGAVFGYTFGAGSAEDDAPPKLSPPDTEARDPEVRDDRDHPPSEVQTEPPAKRAPAQARSPAALARVIDDVPIPLFKGDGEVTGVVRDTTARPVAGALVRLRPRGRRRARPVAAHQPLDRSIEAVVRNAVELHYRNLHGRRDATTDADGTFRVTGVGAGDYYAHVYAEGYDVNNKVVHAGSRDIVFSARPVSVVEIALTVPDGVPRFANVTFESKRTQRQHDWSPNRTTLRLAPGRYRVNAKTPEGLTADEVKLHVKPKTPARVELTLTVKPGIVGRIVSKRGLQSIYYLWILKHDAGPPPDANKLVRKGKQSHLFPQTRGTRFAFENLTPGVYTIGAGPPGNDPLVLETVTVGGTIVQRDLRIPAPNPDHYVRVRVYDPAGVLMRDGVDFTTRIKQGHGTSSSGRQAAPEPDGSFYLRHPKQSEMRSKEKPRYFVVARMEGHGEAEVEYVPGRDAEIAIRFKASATVALTVSGLAGTPYADRVKAHLQPPGARSGSRHVEVEANGTTSLGPVAVGSYDLVLALGRKMFGNVELLKRRVTLVPGENPFTLSLPRLHTLTVALGDGVSEHAQLRALAGSENATQSGRANADGQVTFSALAAGEYELIAGMDRVMYVRVPTNGVIQFRGKTINAARLVVTDPNGQFGKAGFRSGDLIIGVDGKPFEDIRMLQRTVFMAKKEAKLALLVLRDGRQLTISFQVSLMRKRDGLGGSWHPAAR